MHPYLQQQLVQTRVADLRSQAQHHRIGQAARRARRAHQQRDARRFRAPGTVLHHLLSAVLTGYGQRLRPSRQRPSAVAPQLPSASRS